MSDKKRSVPKDLSSFGESESYFAKSAIPTDIHAVKRTITMAGSYIHNQDITFILVTGGSGTITVNGLDYPLKTNMLINLSPFHVYRFTPSKGHSLDIVQSGMNSGTYLYLIANPYYKMRTFSIPSEPIIVELSGLYKDIGFQAMQGLLSECGKDDKYAKSLCFCYMTDLFGLINNKHKKKPTDNTVVQNSGTV